MHRQELLNLLYNYHTTFMEEASYVRKSISYIEQHENVFSRELYPTHVTGSTWVVSPDYSHVLLLHHKKQDQWFQPGGHADGDHDIVRVALKETLEETGLTADHVHLVDDQIFDVDMHSIPGYGDIPTHGHIDIRFLVEIDQVTAPGNDESHDVLWVPLEQAVRYNNNRSTYRMMEKTRRMRR